MRPWAAVGVAVIVAGFVVALFSGGGNNSGGSGTSGGRAGTSAGSSSKLPPGGTMTIVNNAPPPKKGDEVLAAGKTEVRGVYYQVVVSRPRPRTKGPKRGPADVYFNEYMGKQPQLLQRFKVPVQFFRDSVVASFKVEANPDPNPDKTAGIAFSWFHHIGDQTDETKYYGVTTHGIEIY